MSARKYHRRFGLVAAGFGLVLALTGAFLALEPVTEAATYGVLVRAPHVPVSVLAAAITDQVAGAERITRTANGAIVVDYSNADGYGKTHFDAATMEPVAATEPSQIWSTIKELHRSLFLGETGRWLTGAVALAMLVLATTGLTVILRRMGGWRALIAPPKTTWFQALHMDAARVAVLGLLVVSTTGIFLTLTNFGYVSDGYNPGADYPMIDEAAPSLRLTEMKVLRDMPLSQLRELALPYPDDPAGVIGLTTAKGTGFVDPKTGDWASFSENSKAAKIYQFIYMLHTGKGAWYIGVLLGVSMLAVPFLVVSGVVMVLRRPKNPRRGLKSAPARTADTLLLVGTEGTSTWGFAADLARQLTAAGKSVHVADMNDVAEDCPLARHLFVLTATYGQGEAPASARHFMSKVKALRGKDMQFAVLGFGDKTFPQFCKFADDTQAALQDLGLREFHEIERINQQNGQTFSAWGKSVGATLGISLKLTHSAERPKTKKVLLADKHMLGEAVQAPVAILRFRMPEGKKLLRHSAGDLLGVIVPGTTVPRFYSLASSQRDGWIEICVRKQNGGLCSSFLTNMARGDKVDVFIKPNPTFRPEKSEAPMILVGAGAGVGPLVGFLRNNRSKRPAHMFYGGRHPKSDFLYESELSVLKLGGNLTQLTTAFSRVAGGGYVQEQLLKAAEDLRAMVQSGAQILVCGGAGMGTGVRESFDLILAPIGQSVDTLRQEKRYLEDVY